MGQSVGQFVDIMAAVHDYFNRTFICWSIQLIEWDD